MSIEKTPTTGTPDKSGVPTAPTTSDVKSEIDSNSTAAPKDPPSTIKEEDTCISCDKNVSKSSVAATINEASDLITAVESVAAMYGIPSSHIVEDDSASCLRVVEDNIIVPTKPVNPRENGKAIVQSIGAVLDYISQRVDDKLNKFQVGNIEKGRITEHIKRDADPSKGKVISRHVDANGDEILVYDTGLMDMANTKEAHAKADELKASGMVPQYKYDPDAWMTAKQSYFTDEDDITKGTDIPDAPTPSSTSSTPSTSNMSVSTSSTPSAPDTTDVSSSIGESFVTLDTISKYRNTRHLGYDILMEQGFSFVKPVDIIQESASKKKPSSADINHMKFDNTNILKAIKFLNIARAEQKEAKKGKFNIEQFINSPNYQKAVDCLNKQFDARLNIRFFSFKNAGNAAYTSIYNDIKTHLTLSKSKGFQLNGLPIDIFVINTALDEDAPDDISLFGQSVVSVICHEIFHNIMAVLKTKQTQFTASLAATMALAEDVPSAKNRRKLITNFVDSLDEIEGHKLNPISRRALVKHLTYLSTISHDEKATAEYKKAISSANTIKTIDDQIERYSKILSKMKRDLYGPKRYVAPVLFLGAATFAMIAGPVEAIWVTGALFSSAVGAMAGTAIVQGIQIETVNKFKNGQYKNLEEHWCDMFAGMYNLPVSFFLVGSPRKFTPKDVSLEQLKKMDELEREIQQMQLTKYPTINERNQSAVKIAKKALEGKDKLDPSIKKYLEWIVDNYSKTMEMDIDTIYTKGTFDPKTAEDLDKHIENLIGKAKINITEYDLSWLKPEEDVF